MTDQPDRTLDRLARPGTELDGTAPCWASNDDITTLEQELCAAADELKLNGVGIVFDPRFDPGTSYRPYARWINGELLLSTFEPRSADFFAASSEDWYREALNNGGGWREPKYGSTSDTPLANYSSPFRATDGSIRGVVLASYTLEQLADDLNWLHIGSIGYPVIVSREGQLLNHPNEDLVENVFNDKDSLVPGMAEVLRSAGDEGLITGLTDEVSQSPARLGYDHVESTGWAVGAVLIKAELVARTPDQQRRLIQMGLGIILGTWLALVALAGIRGAHLPPDADQPNGSCGAGSPDATCPGRTTWLWVVSLGGGLLAAVGIGLVWLLSLSGPIDISPNERDVTACVLSCGSPRIEVLADDGLPCPDDQDGGQLFAGVFIQSIEFTGANDVSISGIAWQEQAQTFVEGAGPCSSSTDVDLPVAEQPEALALGPPGFVVPEAQSIRFDEQYCVVTGNRTGKGWSFTSNLRQSFEYSRYPLDREKVSLRLWAADYELHEDSQSPDLLPDLSSYETLAASTTPDLEDGLNVDGWDVEGSSFTYARQNYNTQFNPNGFIDGRDEFYFNVYSKRSFLDAMVSHLIPLSVVAILLFFVLIITKVYEAGDNAAGFSTLTVPRYCAALFFVTIIAHNDLRSTLRTREIVYLKFFFFATYIAILLVSANAIRVWFQKKDPSSRDG